MKKYCCSFFMLLLFVLSAFGQSMRTVYSGAQVIPIVGSPINDGWVLVQNGKIIDVGGDASNKVWTADTRIVDVKGKVIMPGLVDSHSHIGEVSGADRSGSDPTGGPHAGFNKPTRREHSKGASGWNNNREHHARFGTFRQAGKRSTSNYATMPPPSTTY